MVLGRFWVPFSTSSVDTPQFPPHSYSLDGSLSPWLNFDIMMMKRLDILLLRIHLKLCPLLEIKLLSFKSPKFNAVVVRPLGRGHKNQGFRQRQYSSFNSSDMGRSFPCNYHPYTPVVHSQPRCFSLATLPSLLP